MLPPGSCLGAYEIIGPIGAGGMGEVYRARLAAQARCRARDSSAVLRRRSGSSRALPARTHEHGIIHRDPKPANTNITPTGTVKVLDLGTGETERSALTSPERQPEFAGPKVMAALTALVPFEKLTPLGTRFDTCSCSVPCPFAQAPTNDNCEGILAWHIRQGNYGDVRLDGLSVMALEM